MSNSHSFKTIIKGLPATDGDGVKLTRIIGTHQLMDLDPFLLLDHFGSDRPNDYIGGFPAHPHRGFETVTYMLEGKMRHQDSAGNTGVIEAGGVQWMSAGSGTIHSEMPEQTAGMLSGFQLWVNLPASAKMSEPKYQEYMAQDIPVEKQSNGVTVKVIAGTTKSGTPGIINNNYVDPMYFDVSLPAGKHYTEDIPASHNAFIYLYEGQLESASQEKLNPGELAVINGSVAFSVQANSNARFILIAGRPLNEPIERAGPFVMNTQAEIRQAFADYQAGQLVKQN